MALNPAKDKPARRKKAGGKRVSYTARISTFGRDFGVVVEVTGDGYDLKDLLTAHEEKLLDEFVVAKHKELTDAYILTRGG